MLPQMVRHPEFASRRGCECRRRESNPDAANRAGTHPAPQMTKCQTWRSAEQSEVRDASACQSQEPGAKQFALAAIRNLVGRARAALRLRPDRFHKSNQR